MLSLMLVFFFNGQIIESYPHRTLCEFNITSTDLATKKSSVGMKSLMLS